jgi:hypothetical protein
LAVPSEILRTVALILNHLQDYQRVSLGAGTASELLFRMLNISDSEGMDLRKSKAEPDGALNVIWNVHTTIDHLAGCWTNVLSTIYDHLSLLSEALFNMD